MIVDDPRRPTRVLAARRRGSLAGYWEFPGGKVEQGETPQQALVRELWEELSCPAQVLSRLDPPTGHAWRINDALELQLWLTVLDQPAVLGSSHDQLRWVSAGELTELAWLPSDTRALPTVRALLTP